jgi:NitT/TauT family transport system substrate-binding protein
MLHRSRTFAALCVALAGASLLAACGSSGGSSGGGQSGKPATLKVGVIPIADVAPLYVGMKQGFFKKEKLTIQPKIANGGPEIVTATVSGDDNIGFSNTTSLIIAASKNIPLQIVSQGVLGAKKPSPDQAWDAVLVKKGSPIKSAKDLEGKTIAVNSLNNVGPLTINTALKKSGADYKKVKYLEVPFPDANAALQAGRVDAAWVVEPFVSQGLAQGSKPVLYPYEQTSPSLTVANYFATKQYLSQNKDVVERFKRAMDKSLVYSQSHPDAVRKAVLTYTKIPPAAAKNIKLPQWKADLNKPTIELTSNLAKEYGYIKTQPNLDDLIWKP